MVGVDLRPATGHDAELLFAWANDPETRRWSFATEPIPWDTHVAWLARVLADDERRLWVAEHEGEPVGQVRLDVAGDSEVVSISVAPGQRGRGLAVAIIRAACGEARGTVVAEVKPDNQRSLRAFERAGFRTVEHNDEVVLSWP